MKEIRFKFKPGKGRSALLWMLRECSGADLHTILKTCYFADKAHLNKYGRPIFGATYRAMRFGPVPVEIYEMAKGEPYWLAELDTNHYPWRLEGFRLFLEGNSEPDLDLFSESDMEELRDAFDKSQSMTFDERTSATHGPDWQAAELGFMRYEDMIDDSPQKTEIIEHLREVSRYVRL